METQKSVRLLLVRHGQAQSNVSMTLTSYPEVTPMPLSNQGRQEVTDSAEKLRGIHVDALFASPLTRTQETASIMSDVVGVPIITELRLRETDFGVYNHQSYLKFFLRYPHPNMRRVLNIESGAEGLDQVRDRIKEFLREIRTQFQGKTVMLVSHADVIRELLGIVGGATPSGIRIDTGSVHEAYLSAATSLD